MKSLKRKFSELVSGGTKTTSHDLTHYVSWAKKLSLRIREKTTGKPFSEPVENSGLMLGGQGEGDDDSSAGGAGLSWGGNALGLTSPSLAPRIRKNRLSAAGNVGNVGDVQHILSYLQMQATTNAQNHQQIVGLLQQVLALMQQQSIGNVSELSPNAAALPVPAAGAKVAGRGRKNARDEDNDDASVAKKARKHSEGGDEEDN